jgi:hypothetical protein
MKGARLRTAGLEVDGLTVYALPLDGLSSVFGMKLAGILGNDVIGRTVAEIDYAGQVLTLYSPSVFIPPKAEMLRMTIEGHLPFVRTNVLVGGRTIDAKMEIDTGSTGAVLFNGPFVRKNRLIARIGNSLASRTGGIGGTGTSRVGRITGVNLGGTVLHEPLAVLFTGSKGDNASSRYDGLLGGAIFRRFKLTVDIPGRRLFLQPTPAVEKPFETDMSGLDLVAEGDDLSRILIDEVKPASAAAKAGMRGGEFIRRVNGRPVDELGIEGVRKLFRTPGEYVVELDREGQFFTVRLILKRVV